MTDKLDSKLAPDYYQRLSFEIRMEFLTSKKKKVHNSFLENPSENLWVNISANTGMFHK